MQPHAVSLANLQPVLALRRGAASLACWNAEGLAAFNKATMELLLGADSPAIKEQRVACLQVRTLPPTGRHHLFRSVWQMRAAGLLQCGACCWLLAACNPRPVSCAVAVQSLSGTGSLRVGAAFIAKFMPGTTVYISRPTWGNHKNIFSDAGVEWKEYRCGGQQQGRGSDLESACWLFGWPAVW